MNRLVLPLLALGLTGCNTARVIASHIDASPATPGVTASVDCQTFTIDVHDYPLGTAVFVGLGSEPPYGFTTGTPDPWGRFDVTDSGGHGTVVVGLYNQVHEWTAAVDVIPPGRTEATRMFNQMVGCGATS